MTCKRICRGVALAVLAGVMTLVTLAPAGLAQEEGRKIKTKVAPYYPELAKRMNVAGSVKLQVTISPSGAVKTTKTVGGHPLLVDAANDAVRKWKFEPAGEETTQVIEFKFTPNSQ